MILPEHPFTLIDWDKIEPEEHKGITGSAFWRVMNFGNVRVRLVEYSPNYLADHWCDKGHFIYCIEGEMVSELKDGRKSILKKGMAYHVGDNIDSHRSYTEKGVKLFIVD
ncbi:MAG: hypothetical protein C4539_17140 [Ignavibacteriales bacterium]|nr:MAG: hypothetical protein C4539_17140 [Ignavibacteriales bacterium]